MSRRVRLLACFAVLGCGDSNAPPPNLTVATVVVRPSAATLRTFDSLPLTAIGKNSAGDTIPGRPIVWSSSDTSRATVTPVGLVRSLRPGPVVIQATIDGVSGQAGISVTPSVSTVTVLAADDSLRPGDSLQFTATMLGQLGNVVTGPTVTWTSSDTVAAMVSASGIVRGRRAGRTLIIATAEGVSGTRALRIMAPVATVAIIPTSVTVGAGVLFSFEAQPLDSVGGPLNGLTVGWTSSAPIIAAIDTGGRLSALQPGSVSVFATSERRTGSATAEVRTVTFAAVAPGDVHSCGIATDHHVFCWGAGGGRLGDSSTVPVGGPVEIAGGGSFVQVGSGVDHACGLLDSGEAYCWGSNFFGQLGQGTISQAAYPVPVQGGMTFRALGVGYYSSCGLTSDSLAYCWGNGYGSTPVAVPGVVRFATISVGGAHACGLTASGAAYCWGANDDGRLGDSTLTARAIPTPVVGGLAFLAISAGGYHTCAVTVAGSAYCWGYGGTGQIGIDSAADINPSPVAVHGGLTFSAIATGLGNSCGLVTSGAVYCWGSNGSGESGPNAGPQVIGGRSLGPVPVGISAGTLAAGTKHVCAITPSGLYCWGSDGHSELGDEGAIDSAIPVRVLSQP